MKIIQIQVIHLKHPATDTYFPPEIYGLGEDNLVYKWNSKKASWDKYAVAGVA